MQKEAICWKIFLDSIRITSSNDFFSYSFLHPSLHTLSSFCFITFVFCCDDSDLTISNDTNSNAKPNFLNYEQCYDLMSSQWTINWGAWSSDLYSTTSIPPQRQANCLSSLYCCFPIYKAFRGLEMKEATTAVELQGRMVILHYRVTCPIRSKHFQN